MIPRWWDEMEGGVMVGGVMEGVDGGRRLREGGEGGGGDGIFCFGFLFRATAWVMPNLPLPPPAVVSCLSAIACQIVTVTIFSI